MGRHEEKHLRNRRHKPYGWKGDKGYCHCDRWSDSIVNKGGERQKAKREIMNGPMEPEYDPREYVGCDIDGECTCEERQLKESK
jgi:hypothetical protein